MLEVEATKSSLVQSLKWRYATKKFDATKKVSTEDLHTLMECIHEITTPSNQMFVSIASANH